MDNEGETMKKTVILIVVAFLLNTCSVSARIQNNTYAEECAKLLEDCNIVNNVKDRWGIERPIKRRDAFSAVATTKSPQRYLDVIYSWSPERLQEMFYAILGYEFSDIKYASDDYYFTGVMVGHGLILGSYELDDISSKLARLEDNLTYGEALVILSRLFSYESMPYDMESVILERYTSQTPYLDYFEDMRIINNQIFSDPCCPQISAEELNQPISAYEFFTLLCRTMYVPAFAQGDYATPYKFYFIDNYR